MVTTHIIPNRFKLLGRIWNVKYVTRKEYAKTFADVEGIDVEGNDESGCCSVVLSTIYVVRDLWRSPDYEQHIFYHELVHAILHSMGHIDHDEIFVDAFAGLLRQFLHSQQGEIILGKNNER